MREKNICFAPRGLFGVCLGLKLTILSCIKQICNLDLVAIFYYYIYLRVMQVSSPIQREEKSNHLLKLESLI